MFNRLDIIYFNFRPLFSNYYCFLLLLFLFAFLQITMILFNNYRIDIILFLVKQFLNVSCFISFISQITVHNVCFFHSCVLSIILSLFHFDVRTHAWSPIILSVDVFYVLYVAFPVAFPFSLLSFTFIL